MKVPLSWAALFIVLFLITPGVILSLVFQIRADQAVDSTIDVTNAAGATLEASHHAVPTLVHSSNVSQGAAKEALKAISGVQCEIRQVVAQLHAKAMGRMELVIDARLDAAEGVTDGLWLSWQRGFLGTCNPDNNGTLKVTTVQIMQEIVEQLVANPSIFKYIYFDEPNPSMPGNWTDCGWGNDPGYALYTIFTPPAVTCPVLPE